MTDWRQAVVALSMGGAVALGCAGTATAQPATAAPQPPVRTPAGPRPWMVGPKLELIKRAMRGYLGMRLIELTPELREHFGASKETGALVAQVERDGPAAKAGVQVGDVVTAVEGSPATSAFDVRVRVRDKKDGESVSLDLVRARAKRTVKVVVAKRETDELDLMRIVGRPGGPMAVPPLIDGEKIARSVEKAFGPEWQENMRRREENEKRLEQRTKELEERLKSLEKRLDEKDGKAKKGS